MEDHQASRPATNIKQHHPQFLFFRGEHSLGSGQGGKVQTANVQARALHTFAHRLHGITPRGDHIDIRFQAHAGGADRVPAAVLAIHQELLGQDV